QFALRKRPDLQSIRDQIAALKVHEPHQGRFQLDSPALGVSHVGDTGGSTQGLGSSGYLLGGYSARTDLGFRFRLHDNGEDEALAAVSRAQIQILELETERMEKSIGWEVKSLRASAIAGAGQVRLAARKVENMEKLAHAIHLREQSGLESSDAAL